MSAMPADTCAAIEAIVRDVQRLHPSWQRPERFHEQKSAILAALRALACSPLLVRQVVRFLPAAPTAAAAPATSRQAAPRRAGQSRPRRHRYPLPARRAPGQGALFTPAEGEADAA
jgi:hypothetical protein